MRFFGIDLQRLYRFGNDLRLDLTLFGERVERRNYSALGVHFKKAPEVFAAFAPAKSVCAERGKTSRDPWGDLVGNQFHIVRDGDKYAFLLPKNRFNVRLLRL